MPKEWLTTNKKGFSLVEVVLSGAVFSLLVTALVGAYLYGQEATVLAGNRARATLLAEEGLEAVRNIRDPAYANLTDGTYGLTSTSNQWNLSGLSDVNGIFTRQVTISTVDSKVKSVTSNVTWQQNSQRTGLVSLATRLTNWIAYGVGNWANPIRGASINISGNSNGSKVELQGNYAYVVLAGGSPDFLVIDISNVLSPTVVGSITVPGAPTNISISGNYAYLSNSDNNQELQIINITVPTSPNVVGTFNASGNADANGVFVNGTTVYITRSNSGNDEFLIIDASAPTTPTLVGSLNLSDTGNEIVVSGNFAYIASSDNSQELQVVGIANPALPTISGYLNLSGNTSALTIALANTTVLIGQGSLLHTINVSNPSIPVAIGSVNTGSIINDIALRLGNSDTYVYIATSDNSNEFRVIDIANLSSPVLLGAVNITTNNNLLGIAYDQILDRAFGVSAQNNSEFIVFAPQ